MNTRDNMIFVKGEIKTAEIAFCTYNPDTKKWDVRFTNGKKYSYAYGNIVWLNNPTSLDPKAFHINRNGYEFSGITEIYEFGSQMDFIGIFVLKMEKREIIVAMICESEVHVWERRNLQMFLII